MPRSRIQMEDELNLLIVNNLIDEVRQYVVDLKTTTEKDMAIEIIFLIYPAIADIFYEGNATHTAFPK